MQSRAQPITLPLHVMSNCIPWQGGEEFLSADSLVMLSLSAVQVMSDEAVDAMRDAYGYDSSVSESNLADHLRHSLPSVNDSDITSYAELRLSLGYQNLVKQMLTSFQQAGGTTYMSTQLISNAPAGGGGSTLTFTGSAVTTVQTSSTVYALPKAAIQALKSPGLSLSTASSQAALESVTAVPAFKIFLAFPSAWWTALGFSGGLMRLTSPIRKLYYWSARDGTPPTTQHTSQ